MKLNKDAFRLYAVTDSRWCGECSLLECVEEALQGGITLLQIREKNCSTQELVALAKPIVELCHQYHVPCIVNDDVEAARLSGADGVHVGQEDMEIAKARAILGEAAWIGTSTHNVEEARLAEAQGADYIGMGAVFGSQTKTDATPMTMETLRSICQAVSIPVVAIGGITKENVLQLKGFGGDGIAVISAIFAQENIRMAAQEMRKLAETL